MQKGMMMSLIGIAAIVLALSVACTPVDSDVNTYGEDRALIEDLQARYMFALDFGDLDTYVATFTEDGILDIIGMKGEGREEIRKLLEGPEESEAQAPPEAPEGPYPATGRHNITNIVLKIDGDTATGRAYWFHMGNDNPERSADVDSYGYYEDEMVKVDGQWLFSKRVIYNEQMAEWIGSEENPSW